MGPAQEPCRSVDVSGLSEEAIRAVEALVAALRNQGNPRATYRSHQEWSAALRAWAGSHRVLETVADDSRESIYSDHGE